MLRTFVVPLDGSNLAERALPYAVRVAQAAQGGRLILTRAAFAPSASTVDGSTWIADETEAVKEAVEYLRRVSSAISAQVPNVEISAPYGKPVEAILKTATAVGADAIIMATHGRTGLAHLVYGSVAEGIVASSSLPVMAVHARPGEAAPPVFSPERVRILVPQDGSQYDAPALNAARDLLGPQSELVLVSVVAPPEHLEIDESGRRVLAYLDQQEEARTRDARDYLRQIADSLRSGPNRIAVSTLIRVGDPAKGIVSAALGAYVDLIVMATHGRTGIDRMLHGSVSGDVLRTTQTPVVLVHPQLEPAPAAADVIEDIAAEVGPVLTF